MCVCLGAGGGGGTHTLCRMFSAVKRDASRRVFSSSLPLDAAPTLEETIPPAGFLVFNRGSSHVNDSSQALMPVARDGKNLASPPFMCV